MKNGYLEEKLSQKNITHDEDLDVYAIVLKTKIFPLMEGSSSVSVSYSISLRVLKRMRHSPTSHASPRQPTISKNPLLLALPVPLLVSVLDSA